MITPTIRRNDWHHGHDYTLNLGNVWVSLCPEEFAILKDAVHAIEEQERPMTDAELDELRAALQEVRDARL